MMRVIVVIGVLLAGATASAQPSAEVARVRAHLLAARGFVAARDVSALTPQQRERREAGLGVLDRYIARGEFPVRTEDAYPGLRPRFIDARGVHCAVGEMIAQTGHEALARQINARFEYSFVRDIREPALLAWAHEYGFTVDELARIQPSYDPPPSEGGIRREIEDQRDRFMLACTDGLPPKEVTVHVECNATHHGSALEEKRLLAFSAPAGSDSFTKCFAAGVNSGLHWPGGAFSPSPHDFSTDMTIQLHSLPHVLDTRLREQIDLGAQCAPRPGALATTATFSVTDTTADGFEIKVTTSPKNSAIEKCMSDVIEARTEDIHHVAGLAYKRQVALVHMTPRRVHDAILLRAPGFATDCYADGVPAQITVTATAKPDDPAFTLSTTATNETFDRCILDKLRPALRRHFTAGGYFRIDAQIQTDVEIAIETPKARDERLAKARKEAIQQRRELEAEIRRHRYGF